MSDAQDLGALEPINREGHEVQVYFQVEKVTKKNPALWKAGGSGCLFLFKFCEFFVKQQHLIPKLVLYLLRQNI